MKNLVEIRNLSFRYKYKTILQNINLDIQEDSKIVIHGNNGRGKSTFLSLLAGLKDDCKESIKTRPNLKIAYLFQDSNDQFIAPSVIEDVAFSLLVDGIDPKNAERLSSDMLERLKISHLKNNSIYYLSGGEKRLVAIAGILVRDADLYLLDEPFKELDEEKTNLVLEILNEKKAFILITHEKKELLQNVVFFDLDMLEKDI
ncbi:ABC transporter ATP-binding protein [Campylobacter pinnipediorum]|uniref:ABC transporter domain-containing protein n=1 Tax=Campylobacter pinnipediorum subsp. pinnipediorum TaxID=1660067 RepID=A0AAX0LCM4_9BACT|nr:ABC transporter ATP-binding protein [Campylobacter pinnipediorum]AQW80460.1 Co/Ni ABC transporter CbiKLMQO, ATP-binding protein CbiO [Campylobacter pinnipediorum subsp. pinnipediorum]AQW82130.1 Co/Ni ABC transporter CbiKLMQO, ATP-binding protein CbiO [Campylobacter pinnipediorum subsp. pinnipediorum]AQW83808.1 Co/Ni ABC transporter CbiKLMQO, ATP-binding protein CbiO [Campylobacter pinnipediorum subsp. pinnipediorum]OPA75452.1 hypothetical protein BFG05_06155 [Campylobacter pinnipediorum subs